MFKVGELVQWRSRKLHVEGGETISWVAADGDFVSVHGDATSGVYDVRFFRAKAEAKRRQKPSGLKAA